MNLADLPRRYWLSIAINTVVVVAMTVGILSVIERLYVVNGNSYPRWLAQGELGRMNDADLLSLRATECKHEPIEVFQKEGFFVLRCGMMLFERSTKTFIADSVNLGG